MSGHANRAAQVGVGVNLSCFSCHIWQCESVHLNGLTKIAIIKDECPDELWLWLRLKLRIPDDGRQHIFLMEGSGILTQFRAKLADYQEPNPT